MSVAKTTVDKLLKGYDIRLRPDFGGTWWYVARVEGIYKSHRLRGVIYKSFHWNLWKEEACGKTQGRALKWWLPCHYYACLHISKMAAPQEVGHACRKAIKHSVFLFFFFSNQAEWVRWILIIFLIRAAWHCLCVTFCAFDLKIGENPSVLSILTSFTSALHHHAFW